MPKQVICKPDDVSNTSCVPDRHTGNMFGVDSTGYVMSHGSARISQGRFRMRGYRRWKPERPAANVTGDMRKATPRIHAPGLPFLDSNRFLNLVP